MSTYLDEVRQLAIAKGINPDDVEKDIVNAAIATNWGVEDIAWSFIRAIEAYIPAKQFQVQMKKIQDMAGHSQEELDKINQSILNMT
jgi:hypothetical protein